MDAVKRKSGTRLDYTVVRLAVARAMQLLLLGKDTTTVPAAARIVATELSINHSVVTELVNLAMEAQDAGDDVLQDLKDFCDERTEQDAGGT